MPRLPKFLKSPYELTLHQMFSTLQNLRSSRETELAESYPLHVVTAWIGNSRAIAAKHYLQVREEDFERAARPESAAQNPAQSAHAKGGEHSQIAARAKNGIGVFQPVTKGCDLSQVLTGQGIGDEGNRTLILAMRPPCAPVTPRPQENYGNHCTGYRPDVNCSLSPGPKIG